MPSSAYLEIEREVEQIRQLSPARRQDPTLIDETRLKQNIEASFRRDNPAAQIAASERLLKGLGLVPADSSLEQLYVEMFGSQVAGYYDPDTRRLYVVSRGGGLGPLEEIVYAHEYTHSLQDQHFGLEGLGVDAIGQGDRSLARLSLVEGDATLVMTYWAQQALTPAQLLELAGQSADPESMKLLESLPKILSETLLFPYTQGLQFVLGLQSSGGWSAVDAAFGNPPDSTEQVLHPEKYAGHEPPIAVALPSDVAARLGTGWSVGTEDTLGELQLRVWLGEAVTVAAATTAAAGWGGDRVALYEGPDGAWAIALRTAWDSEADLEQFRAQAERVVAQLGTARVAASGSGLDVLVASDAAVLGRLAAALGH